MKFRHSLILPLIFLALRVCGAPADTVLVDAGQTGTPFPHFWEMMFGSGRAVLSLRESYRTDLRSVHQATGFTYVRFHDILDDDVGVLTADKKGKQSYNFSYVDQIYDGLLEAGVRPMVELSFMPKALAASDKPHNFWYKPLPNPPKDYAEWGVLVKTLVAHLVSRYGEAEVDQWYFEVWNEPNIDFWTGDPKKETYFHLYDEAARAVKAVSANLRVGGPATAQAAWVADFLKHCEEGKVPVDFVTSHVYASDTPQNVFGTKAPVAQADMVARAARKVYDQVHSSAFPTLPIIWSEYNASARNDPMITDSAYMGPWLANTIRQCDGLVSMMSYWTFSDVFDEGGVVKKPFYGGFGLIAAGHIPKAAYNDFVLLHRLGTQRLAVESSCALATKTEQGGLAIAVWNYADPGEAAQARTYSVEVKNWNGSSSVRLQIVDTAHGSALASWQSMGSPSFPSRQQVEALRQAGQLPQAKSLSLKNGKLELTLVPHALALLELDSR